jgi:hypothetical protein
LLFPLRYSFYSASQQLQRFVSGHRFSHTSSATDILSSPSNYRETDLPQSDRKA